MIDRARVLAARRGSGADYLVASADALPFEDGSFDVVVSRLVMHHLAADAKPTALAEMRRVLAPGGRVLLADLASPAAQSAHHVVAHLVGNHPATDSSLGRLLWDAGFADVTTGTLGRGLLAGARGVRL